MERKSNVIEKCNGEDNKANFDALYKAGLKTEVVDLTSPEKKTKSLLQAYDSQEASAEVKCGDFLSRLGSSSRAIDFNSKSTSYSVSDNAPAFSSTQSRKRKYKLVDNEPLKTESQTSQGYSQSQSQSQSQEKLPQDKQQLIKIIKGHLPKDDYKRLLSALKSYQLAWSLSGLYAELSLVFHKPEHHFMHRGMVRFVRESQRAEYEGLLLLNQVQ